MIGLIGTYKLVPSEWQAPEITAGEGTYGFSYSDKGANYAYNVVDGLLRLTMRFREFQLTFGVEKEDGSNADGKLEWPEDSRLGSEATKVFAFQVEHTGFLPDRLTYEEENRIEF